MNSASAAEPTIIEGATKRQMGAAVLSFGLAWILGWALTRDPISYWLNLIKADWLVALRLGFFAFATLIMICQGVVWIMMVSSPPRLEITDHGLTYTPPLQRPNSIWLNLERTPRFWPWSDSEAPRVVGGSRGARYVALRRRGAAQEDILVGPWPLAAEALAAIIAAARVKGATPPNEAPVAPPPVGSRRAAYTKILPLIFVAWLLTWVFASHAKHHASAGRGTATGQEAPAGQSRPAQKSPQTNGFQGNGPFGSFIAPSEAKAEVR